LPVYCGAGKPSDPARTVARKRAKVRLNADTVTRNPNMRLRQERALSDTATLDDLAAHKAAANGFVRTRWWWIRHAAVIVDQGRIYGQTDVPCDCSDARIFAALAAPLPRKPVWFASHLKRTHQTMRAIWAAGDFGPALEFIEEKDLAEQHLGDWQGLDRREFLMNRRQEPDSFWYASADERAPHGESFLDLLTRVEATIKRITQAHQGSDIVAVVHGGTIRAAIVLALGLRPRSGFAFMIDNCSITRLDHYQGAESAGWRVKMINHRP
jgi:alpha-ribazole phosphatase